MQSKTTHTHTQWSLYISENTASNIYTHERYRQMGEETKANMEHIPLNILLLQLGKAMDALLKRKFK